MSTTAVDRAEQRHRALERGTQIRVARAELKRRIARGEVPAAQVIADPPEEARTWTVAAALAAQYNWRETRARNLLSRLMVRETRTLAELTDHQRARIVRALEGHEKQAGAR